MVQMSDALRCAFLAPVENSRVRASLPGGVARRLEASFPGPMYREV